MTEGGFGFSGAGDDTGDELLALFRPLRDIIGDKADRYKVSWWLSHNRRSFGDVFVSSSAPLAGSRSSRQVSRVAGVTEISSLVPSTGDGRRPAWGFEGRESSPSAGDSSIEGWY